MIQKCIYKFFRLVTSYSYKYTHRQQYNILIKILIFTAELRPMGRPKVEDKLIQIPIPIRRSDLDRYGRAVVIQTLKEHLTKFINKQ